MDHGAAIPSIVQRLVAATNAHDLDALTDCFARGVRSETPAHPSRGFVGSDQVRRNWQAIFGAVPDLTISLGAAAIDEDRVWCELAFDGTAANGLPHRMRGIVIFGVNGEAIDSVRFYMEPVTDDGLGPDQAIARMLPANRSARVEAAGTVSGATR